MNSVSSDYLKSLNLRPPEGHRNYVGFLDLSISQDIPDKILTRTVSTKKTWLKLEKHQEPKSDVLWPSLQPEVPICSNPSKKNKSEIQKCLNPSKKAKFSNSSEWWKSSKERSKMLLSLSKTYSGTFHSGNIGKFLTRTSEIHNKDPRKISWPSSMFSVDDSVNIPNQKRVRKIRLNPTQSQALVLRDWFLSLRKTYNWALRLVKEKKVDPLTIKITDKYAKNTPEDVRISYVRDIVKDLKSADIPKNVSTFRKKTSKRRRFRNKNPIFLKYKDKELKYDSFKVSTKSIKFNGDRLVLFGLDIKSCESLGENPIFSCRICYDYGKYYIVIPEYVSVVNIPSISSENRIVGIDPGDRTIFTCISGCGKSEEIGINSREYFKKMDDKCESILHLKNISSGNTKKKLTKAWYKHVARKKNIISDFHWKTVKHLLDNYDSVVIGTMGLPVSKHVSKPVIPNSFNSILDYHVMFKERLKMKAISRNKVVIEQDENFTSKACSSCGNLKNKLGGTKTYSCVKCTNVVDRDVNGAINILVKASACFDKTRV